ncbi:MAG: SMI1/KNR4 family protein [Planctomycetales bacterium]|nr:SMI1/KNR4 family protein [Planctomycetales bacterium]
MTIDELLAEIESKSPPASENDIAAFEAEIGHPLPDDYRRFLAGCNGGFLGGRFWYHEGDAGIHHIGGFRDESYFSLRWTRDCYGDRIPKELIWIMDDPFGNAICLGLEGDARGKIYFWDHEEEPDPEEWDGSVATADNVSLLTNSFTEFVAGLAPGEDDD